MRRLEGKITLVTGAARGQGEAHARLFCSEGALVVIADVLDDSGEAVARELGEAARYLHLDVSNEDNWSHVMFAVEREFGGLDVLVNNAGIARYSPLTELTLEEYMTVVSVNQVGTFLGMRAAVPLMKERGTSSIVNVSSTSGLVGAPATLAYTASKFAVRGMTKTAALELAPFGIRVNSVHPGGVDTPMLRPAEMDGAGVELEHFVSRVPLQRLAQPVELAQLVLFLASNESSYCTGSEFVADGGLTAGPIS